MGNQHSLATPETSIAKTHPLIAALWDPTRNGDRKPEEFSYGSTFRAWWNCTIAVDHVWSAKISNLTINGTACPCCSGNKVVPSNSLLATHPTIASQWHPTKNDKQPSDFLQASQHKAWWLCPACGHEWRAVIMSRTRKKGAGCKICFQRSRCLSKAEFVRKARQKHGDKYDYSKARYRTSKSVVLIRCPIHGDFSQMAVNHLSGHGCRKCYDDSHRLEDGLTAINRKWNGYVRGAKQRGLDISINRDAFAYLVRERCYYCGAVPALDKLHGVDRYWNLRGYIEENCVPCCWSCNQQKKDLDGDLYIAHLRRIRPASENEPYMTVSGPFKGSAYRATFIL